jgi:protein SCO1/2
VNKVGLVVSFTLFLISGAVLAVFGYRAVATHGMPSGSTSEVDREYQKLPADSKSDWMTGFTLTERSGKEVKWDDLNGKVRVVGFFFSSCPANCLQENYKIREIQQAYTGKDVTCLSITCDPDIDTPDRLREYADRLGAPPQQWLFLTGKLIYVRRVAGELFSVALDKQTHTERLIVCDKWGKIRGTFHWNKLDEITELKLLVDKLLAETEPPLVQEGEPGASAP